MSKAKEKFSKTWDRAFRMVDRHFVHFKEFVDSDEDTEWDEAHDDLFRAGIVLSVAAMDAFFTDRFCEGLTPFIKKHGLNDALIERLEEAGFNTKSALEMFKMQRPHRRLSNMMKKHLERFVTQNFGSVNKLYRAYGFKGFVQRAEGLARRKTLVSNVERLVKRRHQIVHQGDYNAHMKLVKVNYVQTCNRMGDMAKLVNACEALLQRKGI